MSGDTWKAVAVLSRHQFDQVAFEERGEHRCTCGQPLKPSTGARHYMNEHLAQAEPDVDRELRQAPVMSLAEDPRRDQD